MEGPSTSSDPSYFPQSCQEPQLIEQSELSDPICDPNMSRQQAELLGSRLQQWNLLAEGTGISVFRKRIRNCQHFMVCRSSFVCT
jgi:hypothetical protein